MKGPADRQACIRAKQDPTGIEQEQIRPGDLRPEEPVNGGRLPPGDPAQDIGNRIRAGEGGAAPSGHVELAEAVEEIAAADLAQLGANAVVGPMQRPWGS